MYYFLRAILHSVFNFRVDLTDYTQCKQSYKPLAVLLIDEYNAITVIKLNPLPTFSSSPYEMPILYANDEVNKLFHTS